MTDDCQVGRAAAFCCNSGLEGTVNDIKVRIFQFISKVSPSTVRDEVAVAEGYQLCCPVAAVDL